MATLISSGKDIRFTILPYTLDTPIQQELIANPSDYVLGYITHNKDFHEYSFTYTESGEATRANNHWSLAIVKEFPYCEQEGVWIIYNCSPEKTTFEFTKILTKYHQTLHIYNWDTWSIKEKNSKVVIITSWEIF